MQNPAGVCTNSTPPIEARHHASRLNSKFTGEQLSFSNYVLACRDMIRITRSKISVINLNKAVEGNAPFELEPRGDDIAGKHKAWRRGVLLTHGLSDSPYFMRHLATLFQDNGFRVMAVLLPGHGTQPGDLLDVKWQEWARTVAYGTDKLAAEVDEVYLAGYSAGGALSIYQSLQDQRIRGLFLFAPALEISHRAAYAGLHKLVSWLITRQQWVDIKPDKDIFKYESFTKNAAAQMYALTQVLTEQLNQQKLSIPIFAVASADDKTVNIQSIVNFISRQANPANKLILYTSDTKELVKDSLIAEIEWVNSVLPEQKILSSAHTAIVIPPEDEHYGVNGEYANCIHYYPEDLEKYEVCMLNSHECWQGEISDANLGAGILRRLMYNPNFDALKISLKQFITSVM